MGYTLNFAAVWRDFGLLLSGLGLSLVLAVAGIVAGSIIGLVSAFAMVSKQRLVKGIAATYVTAIRNTPILILILFSFFALPRLGLRLDKVTAFILTLSIYAGAYLTEVFRAGLIAMPPGLREAGLAVGLSELKIKALITVPVMLRNVLPSLGNNFVSLFKDTSLAAAISVPELTFYARKINVETFRVVETWLVASLMYIGTCWVIAQGLRLLEQRLRIPK